MKHFAVFGLFFVASAILMGCDPAKQSNIINPVSDPSFQKVDVGYLGSNVSSQTLLAGQSINAGTVSYDDIDTNSDNVDDALKVTYTTTGGWELVETHFFIGTEFAGIPTNKSGNPQIGLFPYKSGTTITGSTTYSIVIPFTTLNFSCPGDAKQYYVAAHASLRKPLTTSGYQTETGWGDGDRIALRGSWAMFTDIWISCETTQEPQVVGKSETAFAYDGDQSGCFQNYSAFITNEKRWGWTNGPWSANTYTWPIYAGAGQCDISKGVNVGYLTVNYNGSSATVTYTIQGTNPTTGLPYSLREVHLYVGTAEFPLNNQNESTISPGQYPKKASDLNTTSYTFTVNNLTGPIYVIAHAVVYGFPATTTTP